MRENAEGFLALSWWTGFPDLRTHYLRFFLLTHKLLPVLVLSRVAYDEILAHARADVPREACGVLVGHEKGDERYAEDARRVLNVSETPRIRYELDPEATLAVFDDAKAAGREVVGFYHSHPSGPPRMSATDNEQAAWPGHVYVLVSLVARLPILDAWTWTGEEFERESVAVRDA